MKINFSILIGHTDLHIEDEAEDQVDAIRKIARWQSIEITQGPQGQDVSDLRFCHVVAKDKDGEPCEYQSLVSDKLGMEFKLGMKRKDKGSVFPKHWEKIRRGQHGDGEAGESGQSNPDSGRLNPPPPPPAQIAPNANGASQPQSGPKQSQPAPAQAQKPFMSDREKKARAYVAMDQVKVIDRDPDGVATLYSVGDRQNPQECWKDADRKSQCSCPDLTRGRAEDTAYVCAHLWAIKLFNEAKAQAEKAAA